MDLWAFFVMFGCISHRCKKQAKIRIPSILESKKKEKKKKKKRRRRKRLAQLSETLVSVQWHIGAHDSRLTLTKQLVSGKVMSNLMLERLVVEKGTRKKDAGDVATCGSGTCASFGFGVSCLLHLTSAASFELRCQTDRTRYEPNQGFVIFDFL